MNENVQEVMNVVETINNHPVAESKIWEDMQCPVLRQWT